LLLDDLAAGVAGQFADRDKLDGQCAADVDADIKHHNLHSPDRSIRNR
jgi:hypothetical protein